MESASESNAPVVQLTAIDEADLRQKFEDLLLTMKPGPVVIDIDLAGVRSMQPYRFLTHEERLTRSRKILSVSVCNHSHEIDLAELTGRTAPCTTTSRRSSPARAAPAMASAAATSS
jgi:hypothetical protein